MQPSIRTHNQNWRGLNTRINYSFMSVPASNFDLIDLTETWLKPSIDSKELFGEGYCVFRADRSSINSV